MLEFLIDDPKEWDKLQELGVISEGLKVEELFREAGVLLKKTNNGRPYKGLYPRNRCRICVEMKRKHYMTLFDKCLSGAKFFPQMLVALACVCPTMCATRGIPDPFEDALCKKVVDTNIKVTQILDTQYIGFKPCTNFLQPPPPGMKKDSSMMVTMEGLPNTVVRVKRYNKALELIVETPQVVTAGPKGFADLIFTVPDGYADDHIKYVAEQTAFTSAELLTKGLVLPDMIIYCTMSIDVRP